LLPLAVAQKSGFDVSRRATSSADAVRRVGRTGDGDRDPSQLFMKDVSRPLSTQFERAGLRDGPPIGQQRSDRGAAGESRDNGHAEGGRSSCSECDADPEGETSERSGHGGHRRR
jgi:hypothetical protein